MHKIITATAIAAATAFPAAPAIAEDEQIFIRECGIFGPRDGCDETTEQWLAIEENERGIGKNHSRLNGAISSGAAALAGLESDISALQQGMAYNRTAIDMLRDDVDSNSAASAGAAALAGIDFVENRAQIGIGLSNFDGTTGYAIKGMIPINSRFHGSVGVFGANDQVGGTIAGVLKF